MGETVGIICEYDPFHLGHARQFALIRKKLPDASIVCVMSGCFTQRGAAALHAPAFRARAALSAGADMVLELPALFAVREAEAFALGGVSLLDGLGFITHLSFGCEDENLALLSEAALLLEQQEEDFAARLKCHLGGGKSYAQAQGAALAEALAAKADAAVFHRPNNILAICYLRALRRLSSPILPLPVLRVGAYHEQELGAADYPSATAVRRVLLTGDRAQAEAAAGYPFPADGPLCHPEALDDLLLFRLRQMDKEALRALPGCGEGLEHLLFRACREATNRGELLDRLKSKRYTRARLSRLLTYGLLGITQAFQASAPLAPYARLLGFRREKKALLSALGQSSLPIIAKAADGPLSHPAYELDIAAYDLWALGAKIPAGLMMRQPVQIR